MESPEVTSFLKLETRWSALWSAFIGPSERPALRLTIGSERVDFIEKIIGKLSPKQLDELETLRRGGKKPRLFEWVAAREAEYWIRDRISGKSTGSVSHTRCPWGSAVVAVGAQTGKILRVGVDLEREERILSPQVADRVISVAERRWFEAGLGALDFWVLKEAAFKAAPDNEGSVVADYEIVDWDSSTRECRVRSEGLDRRGLICRAKLISELGWKLAFAYSVERLD